MKAKVTVELLVDVPSNFFEDDRSAVDFIDQNLRDILYVGTEYDHIPDDFISVDELSLRSYYNLDRKYNSTDYKLC